MKGTVMKILKRFKKFVVKANVIMVNLEKSIDLFKIIYKNILSIIGVYSLYENSPTVWVISMIIGLSYFIYSVLKNIK